MRRFLDLADPRRADAEDKPDLFQVQFLDIIKLDHLRLAFGQGGDRADQCLAQIGLGELLEGVRLVTGEPGLVVRIDLVESPRTARAQPSHIPGGASQR